jgi:hypothetical protein
VLNIQQPIEYNSVYVTGPCRYKLETQGELEQMDENELKRFCCPKEGALLTVAKLFCGCEAVIPDDQEKKVECEGEKGEGNRQYRGSIRTYHLPCL